MASIDIDAPGTSHLFMGNEAIARDALEAGICFASAYPGTPSSEIMGSLAPIAKKMGISRYTVYNYIREAKAETGKGI